MAMALQLNSKLLDITLVPMDISFAFKDSKMQISAHKSVLAMASPVFSKMFYGSLKETKDVIMIEETTEDSFASMIGFIYGKNIHESTMEGLFAVANMAERYDIKALMDELIKKFKSFKLTNENVLETAATALQFGHFEKLSRSIFLECVVHLRKVLTSVEDIVTFANKYAGDEQLGKVALSLLASFKDVTPPAPVNCQNCGQAQTQTCSQRLATYKGANVGDEIEFINSCGHFQLCGIPDKRGQRGRIVKKMDSPEFRHQTPGSGDSGFVTVKWTNGRTEKMAVGGLFKIV